MTRLSRSFVIPAALLAAFGAAQDPVPAAAKPDKEVAEALVKLREIVDDRKCSRDGQAGDVIVVLVKKWQAGAIDKDKKDIIRGLDGALSKGKLREPDKAQLYVAAATALGELGPDGAKPLQDAIQGKHFPDKEPWVPLRETMLKALGKTKDESVVKFLLDTARRDPTPELQAAAGEALGNFEESKDALRKEVVSGLLITYGEMDSRSSSIDPADIQAQNVKKRLNIIAGKWNDALSRLTHQHFDKCSEWVEWYNKNKGKDWK